MISTGEVISPSQVSLPTETATSAEQSKAKMLLSPSATRPKFYIPNTLGIAIERSPEEMQLLKRGSVRYVKSKQRYAMNTFLSRN